MAEKILTASGVPMAAAPQGRMANLLGMWQLACFCGCVPWLCDTIYDGLGLLFFLPKTAKKLPIAMH